MATAKPKKDLEILLINKMRRCKRVPGVLYDQPLNFLKNINYAKYKICQFEPMHDIAHHLEHILDKIPEFLEKKIKQKFIDALKVSYTNKTIYRCCDHRLALAKVLVHLGNNLLCKYYAILYTLTETQHIIYLEEYVTTNQQILRHITI